MSSIIFNKTTKEIELIGSESFIEANFHMIQDLLVESQRLKKKNPLKMVTANKRPKSLTIPTKSKIPETIMDNEILEIPVKLSAIEPKIPEPRQEPKITRPPLRKYFDQNRKLIRSEYRSIDSNQPVIGMGKSVSAPISNEFFISSLKENFGLSKDRIEGIIRDAEREGRVRSNSDGSYEWL